MKTKILALGAVILGLAIAITSIVSREEEYDIIVGRVYGESEHLDGANSEVLGRLGDDFSADIQYIESGSLKASLEELSNQIYVDMIWLEGEEQLEMASELVQKNRSMDYILMGKTLGADTPPNAVGVMFRVEQLAFLAGSLASNMTEANSVGFIGCKADSDAEVFEYGYRAGVIYLDAEGDRETEVHVEYIGLEEDDHLRALEKMADGGADIVFMAVDKLSKEALDLAESRGIGLIVKDDSLDRVEASAILARVKKKSDVAVYEVVKEFHEGNFRGGNTNLYGLEEGAIDIVYSEDSKLRDIDMEKIDILKNLIRSEKMDIPIDEETFTRYLESIIY